MLEDEKKVKFTMKKRKITLQSLVKSERKSEKEILQKKEKKRRTKKTIILILLSLFSFGLVSSIILAFSIYAWVSKGLPDPESLNRIVDVRTSFIEDRNGKLLAEIFNENFKRIPVKYEDMPKSLLDAVVAIEDKRFYEHKGVDPVGLIRVVVKNATSDDVQGASTITMQLTRNALLSETKNVRSGVAGIKRKFQEIILSIGIEQKFSKQEIIRMYLNEINFGGVAYGVGTASEMYFGKNIKEINLPESAMLAAIIQAPGDYDPYGPGKSLLLARRNEVLRLMLEQKKITQTEYDSAVILPILSPNENLSDEIKQKIKTLRDKRILEMFSEGKISEEQKNFGLGMEILSADNKIQPDFVKDIFPPVKIIDKENKILAPHFVYFVKKVLEDKFTEKEFAEGGYTVITSLDYNYQQIAEQTLKDHEKDAILAAKANNGAIVSIDPRNGEVLAMAGSLDYYRDDIDGKFNVATAQRQMGSSFKPYVYASAWKKGFTPDTYVYDVITEFPGWPKNQPPTNFNKTQETGLIMMKNALTQSLNIPAIKAMYLAGIDDTIKLVRDLGAESIDLKKNKAGVPHGLAEAIGSEELTLLEHTFAFSTMANDGEKNYLEIRRGDKIKKEPVYILKIIDKNGIVIFDAEKERKKEKVLDTTVARYVMTVLSDPSLRPGWSASIYPTPGGKRRIAAVKTGTTNDSKDIVVMGGVPQVITGAWVGNTDNTPLRYNADASTYTAKIWKDYMTRILEGSEDLKFKTAEKPIEGTCYGTSKVMANGKEPFDEKSLKEVVVDKKSGLLATELTPESFKEIRKYFEVMPILAFVNPKADFPCKSTENGMKDPEFVNWKTAIEKWYEKNKDKEDFKSKLPEGVFFGKPPEEFDNIHTLENKPKISVLSPVENQVIASLQMPVKTQIILKNELSRVLYFIDNKLIFTSTSLGDINLDLTGIENGTKVLKITAFDIYDNEDSKIVSLKINIPDTTPLTYSVLEISTLSNGNFLLTSFPKTLQIDAQDSKGNAPISVIFSVNDKEKISVKSGTTFSTEILSSDVLIGNNEIIATATFADLHKEVLSVKFVVS
ncbi:MAG: hypothetical protein Fur0024_0290 [Patescibacteria group bacterium]